MKDPAQTSTIATTVAFDLDGTLVETAPDLVAALNIVLGRDGFAPVAYETARKFVGFGARVMLARAIQAENRTVTPETLDRMFDDFIAYYGGHIADHSRAFPGLVEALDALRDRGFRLAVCTNKLEHLSVLLLKALNLIDRFEVVCGQDTFGIQKPDPEILRRTIAAAGGDPARAIMIGDSETDIRTAQAAGIPVIAVDFGYSDRHVSAYNPDSVISHFGQLADEISRFSFEN
jgi:phosphoglycolate phosphatase